MSVTRGRASRRCDSHMGLIRERKSYIQKTWWVRKGMNCSSAYAVPRGRSGVIIVGAALRW
jgi:hypothetical protein